MKGLFKAFGGSAKNTSSCFIKTCICGDVLKGVNKIFIRTVMCNKSRVRAQATLLGVTSDLSLLLAAWLPLSPGGSLGMVALVATCSGDPSHGLLKAGVPSPRYGPCCHQPGSPCPSSLLPGMALSPGLTLARSEKLDALPSPGERHTGKGGSVGIVSFWGDSAY